MSETIKAWQQSNQVSIILHGHSKLIPMADPILTKSDFNIAEYEEQQNQINSMINQLTGTDNYNKIYDSFYSPLDFKLGAITLRLPESLPVGVSYTVSIKVNGGNLEVLPIPEFQSTNQIIFGSACDILIWEDDFIEVNVDFGDTASWNKLKWNNHNMTVGIAGCAWYQEYIPMMPENPEDTIVWTEGDSYYPTNIALQNRSGNNILTDRVYADIIKTPLGFLLQGVRLSIFEDFMMTDIRFERTNSCFYVSILVNGKNVNAALGIEDPVAIDTINSSLKSFNKTLNNVAGYPIVTGDDILLKIYQRNRTARYNGKIIQAVLFGCSSDCITLTTEQVTIYELCGSVECEPKFSITETCDPNKLLESPNKQDPIITA